MEEKKSRAFMLRKLWPLVVSASGAVLMILAFFIPSLQDQWDRYQARKVIQQYMEIGDDFSNEGNYKMALEAFTKAYDLSEGKRLDIEVKRLTAKVNGIYQNVEWGSETPEDLKEVDFEFLLHFQKGAEHVNRRASILTSYGIYLAGMGKPKESQQAFEEAISLNPNDVLAYINRGNLMDQLGKAGEAEKMYLKAILTDPKNVLAHYNLGLLLMDRKRLKEAEREFSKAIELNPADSDAVAQRRLLLEK
jgi:tetratricopeptide (TPR) repeat protein